MSHIEECLAALPTKLKIGAYDWSVMIRPGASEKCGQADFEPQHINLWPANLTSPGHVVGIVIHEALHVIFDNAGLEHMRRGKEEREEQIIGGFEAGIVSLLRDNPKLMIWMKRWLK